jgi:hypothetical protein
MAEERRLFSGEYSSFMFIDHMTYEFITKEPKRGFVLNNIMFLYATYSLVARRRFRRICYLHLQGRSYAKQTRNETASYGMCRHIIRKFTDVSEERTAKICYQARSKRKANPVSCCLLCLVPSSILKIEAQWIAVRLHVVTYQKVVFLIVTAEGTSYLLTV